MTAKEQGLPELPSEVAYRISWSDRSYRGGSSVSFNKCHQDDGTSEPLFTADQMRAYALAALASDTGERGVVLADLEQRLNLLARSNKLNRETVLGRWADKHKGVLLAALRAQPAGEGPAND